MYEYNKYAGILVEGENSPLEQTKKKKEREKMQIRSKAIVHVLQKLAKEK